MTESNTFVAPTAPTVPKEKTVIKASPLLEGDPQADKITISKKPSPLGDFMANAPVPSNPPQVSQTPKARPVIKQSPIMPADDELPRSRTKSDVAMEQPAQPAP